MASMEGGAYNAIVPGFYFRPSDEDLMMVYLLNKFFGKPYPPNMIEDYDVYSTEPWNLPSNTRYCQDGKSYYFTIAKKSSPRSMRLLRQAGDGCWHMNGTTKKLHDKNGVHVGSTTALTYLHGSKKKKTRWVMHEYRVDHSLYDKYSTPQATELVLYCIQESGRGEEIINNKCNSSSNRIINNSHQSLENESPAIIKVPKTHTNMTLPRKRQRGQEGCFLLPVNNNEAWANLNSNSNSNTNNNGSINIADGVAPETRSIANYNGCYHAAEEAASAYCYTSPSYPMSMPMITQPEVYVNPGEITGTQQATAVPYMDLLTKDDDDPFAQELEDMLQQYSDTPTTPDPVAAAAAAEQAQKDVYEIPEDFPNDINIGGHAEPGTAVHNTDIDHRVNMAEAVNITTDQAHPVTVDASAVMNGFNIDDIPCFSIESMDEFLSSYHREELGQSQLSDGWNTTLDQWLPTIDISEFMNAQQIDIST